MEIVSIEKRAFEELVAKVPLSRSVCNVRGLMLSIRHTS